MWLDFVVTKEEDCVKENAIQLAREIRRKYLSEDEETFSINDMQKIAQDAKIRVQEIEDLCDGKQKHYGNLRPINDPKFYFLLCLEMHLTASEKKFTFAHEIGHMFFYDRSVRPPTNHFNAWKLSGPRNRFEEYFSDVFASALLYPLEYADKCRRWNWSDPDMLRGSAELYEVSHWIPLWVQLNFSRDFWSGVRSCLK